MPLKRWIWTLPLLLMSVAISPIVQSFAQANCPDLVQRALEALGDNCANMDRNSACYGYNLVSAEFTDVVAEDFFIAPADRAELALLSSLGTSAMDVEEDLWGVAVLNLQANIPNTMPGQAVKFVLLGDTEIENAVPEAEAFNPVDPVSISSTARLTVRSAPTLNANVISIVNAGVSLPADGKSTDEAWLRVVNEGLIGWVARDYVTTQGDVDALPVITNQNRMPMQAFYLRTGVQQPACEEAPPNSILIQGPDNIVVNLTINGAEIELASTMIARVTVNNEGKEGLEVISISGSVVVEDENLIAGERTWMPLSEPEDLGNDGEANDQRVESSPVEPTELNPAVEYAFCKLNEIDATSVLNYTVPIDCENGVYQREEDQPTTPPADSNGDDSNGDDDDEISGVDCSGLSPTSPLGQVSVGTSTFYWDAAADDDIDSYQVNVFDTDGSTLSHSTTTGLNAEINAPTALGQALSWNVDALIQGKVVCTSDMISLITVGRPGPTEPPPFDAYWICDAPNSLRLYWSNLPAGETMNIYFEDNNSMIVDVDVTDTNGALKFSGSSTLSNAVLTLSPSGVVKVLPGGFDCYAPVFDVGWYCKADDTVQVYWHDTPAGETISVSFMDSDAVAFSNASIDANGYFDFTTSAMVGDATVVLSPSGYTETLPGGFSCDTSLKITNYGCWTIGLLKIQYEHAVPYENIDVRADDGTTFFNASSVVDASGSGEGLVNIGATAVNHIRVESALTAQFDSEIIASLTCP